MEKPIRILHVLGRLDRGGAETMVMNIYRNIDRTRIQFDFVKHTDEKCDFDDEIISLGGKIYSVPRYNGKNHLRYIRAWLKLLSDNKEYKIIHGHMRSTASIYLKIAKKLKIITIAHSHNTSSGKGFSALVKNILQYPIRNIADYLFACSIPAGRWLFGSKHITKDNFFIINNAINTKAFSYNKEVRLQKRKELDIQNNFVLGHVGRFHPQKNHDFLIEIFIEMQKINKNTILLLVGNGELVDHIKAKVDYYGIKDKVKFLGMREDVPQIFQAMDAFVLPSHYEGLGIVAIEAQASGLPCIISSNLPQEVSISKLVSRVGLNKAANYWASHIMDFSRIQKRENMDAIIKEQGYDIHDMTKSIQDWYLKIYGEAVKK